MQLICDIGELSNVFTDSLTLETFLDRIVTMVAHHMDAAVCSVYMYDEDRGELVLSATRGLKRESVGNVRMKSGEGLTGLALKELRTIHVEDAHSHPNYKFFPGILEERYDAFLAVPILRGLSRIGVLVVQRLRKHPFSDRDILALRAVSSQLANMLENARLFMSLSHENIEEKRFSRGPRLFKGKVASEGFALGPVRIIKRDRLLKPIEKTKIAGTFTIEDFNRAVQVTGTQLQELQKKVEEKLSDVASLIFTAHLLLLRDNEFVGAMARKIESGMNPPEAVLTVARHYMDIFNQRSDSYIREKVYDIEDLAIRLLGNIVKEFGEAARCDNRIVIAADLFPSDLLKLSSENVAGIILVTGGVTSHLSILARSLGIPMLIIDSVKLLSVREETQALLDAEVGNLHLNPSRTVVAGFAARNEARKKLGARIVPVLSRTTTKDGKRIRLTATINLISELELARAVRCEGIGLYRTEFPFLVRSDFPSEEEQYVIYRRVVEEMRGTPVTFRTLDIGGDKVLSYYEMPGEQNPFLGMRSIRFSLGNRPVFLQQVRAMLRAGAGEKIRISFPMISSLEEFLEAKEAVMMCSRELSSQKILHNDSPQIGVMIEVPSLLGVIDEIAKEADFFSIGSNDLVQYLLAVDRTNEKVASLYIPHHPSVLRAIHQVVSCASRHGIDVTVCGDMAHRETYLPFLIGAGVSSLSLEPVHIPRTQALIGEIDSKTATKLVSEVLSKSRIGEIAKLLKIRSA